MDDVDSFLKIDAIEYPPVVKVSTQGAVASSLWLQVLAEWGSHGPNPSVATDVPRERFLSRLGWLRPACNRTRTGIIWNDLARALVHDLAKDRDSLHHALDTPSKKASVDLLQADVSRFVAPLHSFQRRDLQRLAELAHGANFSVPGAGKTAVALGLFELERLQGRVDRLLVISPLSAFDSWTTELSRWFNPALSPCLATEDILLDDEIVVTNYQRLESFQSHLTAWMTSGRAHLILDEAHRIKRGWTGQWGRLCLRMGHLAARRDVLTGTPAPQHPKDLLALVEFLWSQWGRSVLPTDALTHSPDDDAIDNASKAIRPLFVRTTKSELRIPEPTIIRQSVAMTPLQDTVYRLMLRRFQHDDALTTTHRAQFVRMGQIVMYLLEAACNPALLPAGSSSDDPITFRHPPLPIPADSELYSLLVDYGNYETPAKFVQLTRLVDDNIQLGRKTLVWSNFVRNIEYLARIHLASASPAMVHGGISREPSGSPERNRVDELKRFRTDDDCMVLVANPAALGEGISLHDICHDAVYLDRTFNAGQYLQSLDRIHRLGLPPDAETRITILSAAQTIDEIIERRVSEKCRRLETLMDDPELTRFSLPDEEEEISPWDDSLDIEALLAHMRGDPHK